jgi:mitogen-activated protein kinase kinase kinase
VDLTLSCGFFFTAKTLTEAELVNICQTPSRPERQRLILRRIHHLQPIEQEYRSQKASRKLHKFFGEDLSENATPAQVKSSLSPTSPTYLLDVHIPTTTIEPAGTTPSSPSSLSSVSGADVKANSDHSSTPSETKRRKRANRASTVSVMSSLLDWNAGAPPSSGGQRDSSTITKSPSAGPGRRLRNFFGHRPPSELISSHFTDYFPAADGKKLSKTVRQSMRKSIARRDSQWAGGGWAWENGAFADGALDPPPPLPAKDNASTESLSRTSTDSAPRAPSVRVASPPDDDGDTLSVRSIRSARQRPVSRASVGSRLTTKSRDSDAASLLTVDEITAEVESRRASEIYGSEAGDDEDDDDDGSSTRQRSTTVLARYSSADAFGEDDEDGEEEEAEEGAEGSDDEDEDSDDGTAEDTRAPTTSRELLVSSSSSSSLFLFYL